MFNSFVMILKFALLFSFVFLLVDYVKVHKEGCLLVSEEVSNLVFYLALVSATLISISHFVVKHFP